MDFKDIIKTIAPIAGSLIGSPLAGVAIAAIGDAIGMKAPTVERIAGAIQSGSLTPEQVVAVRASDAALKIRLRELDLDHEKIEADTEKAYLADTQDARKAHAGDSGVYWLGISVLFTFAVVMVACLYGCYQILTDGLKIRDVGIVAAVFGFLGTVVGYVAANAQQVVSYFFGSSRGSTEKSREMADAIKKLGAT
jgi:hypothetical protein